MAKHINGWDYEQPVIEEGDTTVVRHSGNIGLRINLTPYGQYVSTRYYNMNGNGEGQDAETLDRSGAIRDAREVAKRSKKDWEMADVPQIFNGLINKGKQILGFKQQGGILSYLNYIQ